MHTENMWGPDPGGEQIIIDIKNQPTYCCGICLGAMTIAKGNRIQCSRCGMSAPQEELPMT